MRNYLLTVLMAISVSTGCGLVTAQGTGSLRITSTLAQYTPSELGTPVLLRINSWYLWASYPTSPFLEKDGSVMVPLRTVGELLGGKVQLDPVRRSGTLVVAPSSRTQSNQKLEFRGGSNVVINNGQRISVTFPAIWLDQYEEIVVPLKSMLAPLSATVKSKDGIVHLESDLLERSGKLSDLTKRRVTTGYRSTNELRPENVAVRRVTDIYGKRLFDISLSLEQVSERSIQPKQEGLFTYLKYRNGKVDIGGPMTALELRIGPQNLDPCVKDGSAFRCRTYFFSGLLFDYVLGLVTLQ